MNYRKEILKIINQIDKDIQEDSKKPLLIPKNNREYWLFTEYRQLFVDLLNKDKKYKRVKK